MISVFFCKKYKLAYQRVTELEVLFAKMLQEAKDAVELEQPKEDKLKRIEAIRLEFKTSDRAFTQAMFDTCQVPHCESCTEH